MSLALAEKLQVEKGMIPVEGGDIFYKRFYTGHSQEEIPLLVLHGGPGVPHNYLEGLSILAAERPIIFYDQLGCGFSDQPKDENLWNVPRFVDEISKVRDALGLKKIHLLGHSWGAALAIEHALKGSQEVVSLTLASPLICAAQSAADSVELVKLLPENFSNVIFESEKNGDLSAQEYLMARMEYGRHYLCRLNPLPEALQSSLKLANEQVRRSLWGQGPRHPVGKLKDYDLSPVLKNISQPILITCGLYDCPRPSSLAEYIPEMKNAQLKIFQNSSHMPHLEEPEPYLEVLKSFLR